ncbi:MAG: Maf family protein, partial [Ruminococcus sp.]
ISDADETLPDSIAHYEAAQYLSVKKAEAAAKKYPDDIVIGCDTVVLIDGKILGKPSSDDDARNILLTLSGRTHEVVTGCTILCRGTAHTFSETTAVGFYELSDREIDDYIATGESSDKAGAYGIQGKGALFVRKINGDYYNVVGLPIAALSRKLKEILKQNKGE